MVSKYTDAELKALGLDRHGLKFMGTKGGLASAKAKGNLSDHDYLVYLNRAKQEWLRAEIAHKLSG